MAGCPAVPPPDVPFCPPAALEVAHQHHRVLLHVEDHRQIRAAGGLPGPGGAQQRQGRASQGTAAVRGTSHVTFRVISHRQMGGGTLELLAPQGAPPGQLLASLILFCVLRNA